MKDTTMKTELDITITANNADELESFAPVTGNWFIGGGRDEHDELDVVESIRNWMDAPFDLDVSVYHADGRAITSDLPSEGQFIAVRK